MAQLEMVDLTSDDRAARLAPERPTRLAGRFMIAGCVAVLLVACTAEPTPTPVPTATFGPTLSPDSPAASQPGSTPSPPSIAPPTELPGFVTPLPPDPAAAWTGIVWRPLAADDPLQQVRSVVRWRGGYVAVGVAAVTGETSASPIWTSTDGGSWRRLSPDVFGPATIVLGVAEAGHGLVAMTLQGGENACGGEFDGDLDCLGLSSPLQAWTSPDGIDWTPHAGPQLELLEGCEGCGIEPPILAAGPAGLLVMSGYVEAAFSSDGIAWEILPSGTIPSDINPESVTAFGSGFVGVGERNVKVDGQKTFKPIATTTSDARTWTVHPIPVASFDRHYGAGANRLIAGPDGLIAQGSIGGAPGFELWWSSRDGASWTQLADYPPLGTWTAFEDIGSGRSRNGTLIGNGERLIAYRGEKPHVAWTSFAGRSWARLAIDGDLPRWETRQYPELVLTPMGVIGFGPGETWFGQPRTD
jgi:hypothetical protein